MILIYFLIRLKCGDTIGIKVVCDHCCKFTKYSDHPQMGLKISMNLIV